MTNVMPSSSPSSSPCPVKSGLAALTPREMQGLDGLDVPLIIEKGGDRGGDLLTDLLYLEDPFLLHAIKVGKGGEVSREKAGHVLTDVEDSDGKEELGEGGLF